MRLSKNSVPFVFLACSFEVLVFFFFFKSSPTQRSRVVRRLTGETLDYSAQYRVVRFYRSSGITHNYTFHDVTIATQCSVNHLHHLVELLQRWDGPVSCAVFVPNQDASFADDSIIMLKRCFPNIRHRVTFHLVYPSNHMADLGQMGSWLHLSCSEVLRRMENYGYQNYDVAGIAFPHNILRNAARSGVLTHFVLLVDIDVMPNVGLRHQFLDFASRHSLFDDVTERTAFVLPAFEVKEGLKFPEDKKELLEGLLRGSIRPFHNETCWWCHKAENVPVWRNIPQSESLEIAFEGEWDKSWEPFYIATRRVPMFDERFKQYGFDRIQQICEMHVAGYQFMILNNAFLTHHGWKIAGKFYASKDKDNAQNWVLFNYHFKDELLLKYNTSRSCSPLDSWKPRSKKGTLTGGRVVIRNWFDGQKRN